MSEVLEGRLASLTFKNKSASNWSNYEMAFDDGAAHKVTVPPDGTEPKVGDTIKCRAGKFKGTWILEKPEGSRSESRHYDEKKSSSTYEKKEAFWEDKGVYEQKIRDPKIEKQFYVNFVGDIYKSHPDLNGDELNDRIDQIVAKADEIFKNANK